MQTPRYKVTTKGSVTTVRWVNKPNGLPVASGFSPTLLRNLEEARARASATRRRRQRLKGKVTPKPKPKKKPR